jgi:hypothetical protein
MPAPALRAAPCPEQFLKAAADWATFPEHSIQQWFTCWCARPGFVPWLMQTSCGAGLPVLSTLKGLIETGDKIIAIEGVLSGTLSYIFNTWMAGEPFSSIVLKAKELGFTEPDPREDLSGMDVARKVLPRITWLSHSCSLTACPLSCVGH